MGRLIAEMNEDYGRVELEYIPNFKGGWKAFKAVYEDENGFAAIDLIEEMIDKFFSSETNEYFYISSDKAIFPACKIASAQIEKKFFTIEQSTVGEAVWTTGKVYTIVFPLVKCSYDATNKIIKETDTNVFDAYPYVYITKKEEQSYDGEIYTILKAEENYLGLDTQVEQGIVYEYGWSKNKPGVVETVNHQEVYVDFEDVFLSDAEHSLRIRYNPQVSTFKTIIQEQKIETMGRQFPIFVRNGNIKYKEIALSGLISYTMDDWFFFNGKMTEDEIRTSTTATGYQGRKSGEEFYLERKFKIAVEEWLNNGKPKLFRSAAEGNYLIRLMNVSLSPENRLARRLHSFSATGYEIAELNFDSLKQYNMNAYDEYTLISMVAGLNTLGKVRSNSNTPNTVRIDEDGILRLNIVSLDQFTEGIITPEAGDIIPPSEIPDSVATNEEIGGVQSSTQINEVNVNQNGDMFINKLDFSLWTQKEDEDYIIGAVEESSGFAPPPTGTNQQGNLSLVKGSYEPNAVRIDFDGEMIVNQITDDNIYIPDDLVIGEV